MNILILGANGKVGSRVAKQLIARGHSVIAGVHHQTTNVPAQATIVKINISDQSALLQAMSGVDVVICALSSWHAPRHNVLSTAMQTVIPAMRQAGVKRIISVSGDVARLPGEHSPILVRLFHLFAVGAIKKIVQDSEDHLRQLHESGLNWTVIRPTTMTSANKPNYRLQQTPPTSLFIPRVAVVASIVDLAETGDHIHEAPFIVSV